jgi:hypothetical protein
MENFSSSKIVYIIEKHQAYSDGCQIIDVYSSLEKGIEAGKIILETIFSRDRGRKKYKVPYTINVVKFITDSLESYEISILFEDDTLNYDTFIHVSGYQIL